jgi:hypothetical protein
MENKKQRPRNPKPGTRRPGKLFSTIVLQNMRRARYDIAQWRQALKIAENVDNPNRARLYDIYTDCGLDALLTSQLQNRKLQTLGTACEIVNEAGEPDETYTRMLQESAWFPLFVGQLLETPWWGHSLWEIFGNSFDSLAMNLIPRKHVKPQTGEVLDHEYDTGGAPYREMREYGRYLIEAGGHDDLGLLNKAVPHILMKRFAQSCWSEFCEIFGMPMRTLKTNTGDPEMLSRAEAMMHTMGAANYSIIDDSEVMEYAEASNATGDVYKYLIALCNNEISLLVLGSILGQDTEHGTRGKEQVSLDILSYLVKADVTGVQNYINSSLFPALAASGFIPANLSFRYRESEDLDTLWTKVKEALIHYDIPAEWIEDKFGIPVTVKEHAGTFGSPSLNAHDFFG